MGLKLHQLDSKAEYYQEPAFLGEGASAFHGFFTRRGGVSGGIYKSLNCGAGSDDEPGDVQENRALVAAASGVQADHVLSLYQVHGKTCLYVTEPWPGGKRPEADALVTDVPGLALGILTADCGPILFYGEKADGAPVIGAAHAGWKGALGGVMEETIWQMEALGAQDIRACVGPCIGRRSYEVSAEFVQSFVESDSEYERFFSAAQRGGHAMFDLPGFCAFRLHQAGLKNVALMDLDTYAMEDTFFSYRRTTHRSEPDYGRQISVIAI